MTDTATETIARVTPRDERLTVWEELGQPITSRETALTDAGLNWTVSMGDVYDADMRTIDGSFVVKRDDNGAHLGIVGGRYEPVQNESLWSLMETVLDVGDLELAYGGTFREGRVVFMLAQMPDQVIVGDDYHRYLMVSSAHDGTLAVKVQPTSVRVVCWNTLMAARAGGGGYRFNHTNSAKGRIIEARNALKVSFQESADFSRDMERLADLTVTDAAFEGIVKGLLPERKSQGWEDRAVVDRDRLRKLWHEADTVTSHANTGYAAVQAVNEWEQHGRIRRPDAEVQAMAMLSGKAMKATRKTQAGLTKAIDRGFQVNADTMTAAL